MFVCNCDGENMSRSDGVSLADIGVRAGAARAVVVSCNMYKKADSERKEDLGKVSSFGSLEPHISMHVCFRGSKNVIKWRDGKTSSYSRFHNLWRLESESGGRKKGLIRMFCMPLPF